MTSGYLPGIAGAGDLVAELAGAATEAGANTGLWPGLTIYRFTTPAGPTWEEIQSLSLCVVAQGRKSVTVGGETYHLSRSPPLTGALMAFPGGASGHCHVSLYRQDGWYRKFRSTTRCPSRPPRSALLAESSAYRPPP
jgi:hypothetical protein